MTFPYDIIVKRAKLKDEGGLSDIGVKNGIIEKIGSIREDLSSFLIDAKGKLVIPGLVNSHTHLDKANLACLMKSDQFGKTLEENRALIKAFKEQYTLTDLKKRARKAALDMLDQGTVAIGTQVDVDLTGKTTPLRALSELKEELDPLLDIRIAAFPQEGILDKEHQTLIRNALKEGADLLGGLPLVEKGRESQLKHIDILFDIAGEFDKDLEVQIDESNDPDNFLLPYLAKKTIKEGFQGRVTATHCISLARISDERAYEVMEEVKKAQMNIIVTPGPNLITRFPEDKTFRSSNSITRVKDLLSYGINVAIGTDNIRDIFYPIGNGSMIREMYILATTTRMLSPTELSLIINMATINGSQIMRLNHGIEVGREGTFLITDFDHKEELFTTREHPFCYVVRKGKVIRKGEPF